MFFILHSEEAVQQSQNSFEALKKEALKKMFISFMFLCVFHQKDKATTKQRLLISTNHQFELSKSEIIEFHYLK